MCFYFILTPSFLIFFIFGLYLLKIVEFQLSDFHHFIANLFYSLYIFYGHLWKKTTFPQLKILQYQAHLVVLLKVSLVYKGSIQFIFNILSLLLLQFKFFLLFLPRFISCGGNIPDNYSPQTNFQGNPIILNHHKLLHTNLSNFVTLINRFRITFYINHSKSLTNQSNQGQARIFAQPACCSDLLSGKISCTME